MNEGGELQRSEEAQTRRNHRGGAFPEGSGGQRCVRHQVRQPQLQAQRIVLRLSGTLPLRRAQVAPSHRPAGPERGQLEGRIAPALESGRDAESKRHRNQLEFRHKAMRRRNVKRAATQLQPQQFHRARGNVIRTRIIGTGGTALHTTFRSFGGVLLLVDQLMVRAFATSPTKPIHLQRGDLRIYDLGAGPGDENVTRTSRPVYYSAAIGRLATQTLACPSACRRSRPGRYGGGGRPTLVTLGLA